MNVSSFITKYYENKSNWTLGENKAKTNPNQTQIKPNSNPILSAIALAKADSNGALHYQADAGILTSETLSGVAEQRLSALGQPENNISKNIRGVVGDEDETS